MAEGDDPEDKTEEPSQKKLDDAHAKGDVAKSQEVPSFFIMFVATLLLLNLAPYLSKTLAMSMKGLLANVHSISMDGEALRGLILHVGIAFAQAILPFVMVIALAAVAGHLIQHRMVWSAEGLTPKFSKISPMAGMKRLFSADSLANFGKGVIKIIVVGAAAWMTLWSERDQLDLMVAMDASALMPLALDLIRKLMIAVLSVMFIIAGLDYAYQRHQWMQRQRMSVQERKEEHKQQEGSPEVKARVRQIRRERSRKRMMAEVPNATVVVTNPTHYAVALKYEMGMEAPICVAKGVDAVALRIREVATSAGVTIVENPPLARALHASVEIEDAVPPEHFKAVAQVIGYVLNLKNKRGWSAGSA